MLQGRRPVCLFAHFDPAGRIGPHVIHYVAALAGAGYRVVLASSGTQPPAEDIAAARSAGVDDVMYRANAGLDFGAWQALLRAGHAEGAPGVLLANDSVYGPLWPLGPVIDGFVRPRHKRFDAWGMVESNQGLRHLQSWFVHLDATVLAAPAVRRVFEQPFAKMHKKEIVVRGELALAAAMDAEGVQFGAIYDRRQASTLGLISSRNAMHLDWRHMLTGRYVPFLKAELLRSNPLAVSWVAEWPSIVEQLQHFPPAWIHQHLYSYVGREPPYAGAPFPTPTPPSPWQRKLLQAFLTRDHLVALRSMFAIRRVAR